MKVRLKSGGPILGDYHKTVRDRFQIFWYVAENPITGSLSIHRSDSVELFGDSVIPKELHLTDPAPSTPAPSLSTFDFVFRETYHRLIEAKSNFADLPSAVLYSLVERARQVADIAARANGETK